MKFYFCVHMRITVIDNHDSFTYNLVELLREAGAHKIYVMHNDQILNNEIGKSSHIIIGPGPGIPSETTSIQNIIKEYCNNKSILGVCLGFQAIVEVFGGALKRLDSVMHGVSSRVDIVVDNGLFTGIPSPFAAGRYHSWVVDRLPSPLITTAVCDELVMAVKHTDLTVQGIQFHPESFLTPQGLRIIKNWMVTSNNQ